MKKLFPMRFKKPKIRKKDSTSKQLFFSRKNPLRWTGVFIILLISIFNIDWNKHPAILLLNEQITTSHLSKHIDKHLYSLKSDKKHKYLQYQIGIDTITVRFTKDTIVTLSNYEYASPRYGWHMGYLSYQKGSSTWRQLHDKFGSNDDFIVPIVANRMTMWNLENQLYNRILPTSLRQDHMGNIAKVIKQWD